MTAIAEALSAALLDFVWQGLLAAFLLWVALFLLRHRSARARYAASCMVLPAMAVIPLVTAYLAWQSPALAPVSSGSAVAARPAAHAATAAGIVAPYDWAGWMARWALPVWSLGVLVFSLRLVWASRQVAIVRRKATPAGDGIRAMVEDVQERLRLTRPVPVLITALADCPSVVGWFRPVVMLPAASVLGLTPQQLEAVLAHELAHILRHDYLVNMLQTVVETLLFYHPAVWWVSGRIRQERELCCDDLAVESCGDALCYARALTRLERLRMATPQLALGSTGGSLLYRIQRLAGDAGRQRGPAKLPGILALSLGLICFGLNMQWARGQQTDEPGVRVNLGSAQVLHRDAVEYPERAIERNIQGSVVVEATLDAEGAVSDARVLSGPQELRKAALQSVLQWHFVQDSAGSTRQVSVDFQLPAEGTAEERELRDAKRKRDRTDLLVHKQLAEKMAEEARLQVMQSANASEIEEQARRMARALAEQDSVRQLQQSAESKQLAEQLEVLKQQAGAMAESASAMDAARQEQLAMMEKRLAEMRLGMADFKVAGMFNGLKVKSIRMPGLSSEQQSQLLAKLPVQVGDTLAADSMERIEAAIKLFDEHLNLSINSHDGQVEIRISPR